MTKVWRHYQVRFADVNGGVDKCVYRKAPREMVAMQWATLDLAEEVGLTAAVSDWRLMAIAEVSEEHFAIAVARKTINVVGTDI